MAVLYSCAGLAAAAELPAGCTPPERLATAMRSTPAARVFDAVGAWFAEKDQIGCAQAAFQEAVRIEPNSAEAHYDYGVALVRADKLSQAAQEFRHALRIEPSLTVAHSSLGSVLLDEDRPAEAESEFREVIDSDPKSVFALDHLAQALSAERRYDAALRTWKQALELQPGSTDIRLALATATYEDGVAKQEAGVAGAHDSGAKEAIDLLQQLTASEPGLAVAHFTLGNIFAREARFREAADEYGAAVRIDRSDTVSLLAEVKALDTVSAYQEALAPVQEYVRLKPANPEGHLLLGAVYRGLGEDKPAEAELQRAVTGNPNDFQSQYQLGFVLARLDKPKEALPHLMRAVQLKPEDSSAQFQLAGVLRTLGQAQQATAVTEDFKKSKERQFKISQLAAQGNQANQFLESGQPAQAAALYREMLHLDPDNAHTEYNLALALEAAHDMPGAITALELAAQLDPKMALARSELGSLDLAKGDLAKAQKLLEQAVQLDPQLVSALGNLGVIYAQRGNIGKAEALLRQAIEDDGRYAQGHLNLGLILAQQQKYAAAESELNNALELAPADARTLSALGKVECRLGKSRDGIALLERVAASEPDSAGAHLDLAIAEADGYDLKDALAQADAAVRLAPNAAATHFNRGALLFDLGRTGEAAPEFEAAVRAAPEMPQPHYYLALAAKQSGDYDKAIHNLQILVKYQPRNVMGWHLLGQCFDSESKQAAAIDAWKHALSINPQHTQTLWTLGQALKQANPAESARLLHQFGALQTKNKITDRAGTLNNDAVAAMEQDDWDTAARKLKEALEICAHCAATEDIHKNLGLVYCHAGEIDQGEKELRLVEAVRPGDPDVARALKLIEQLRAKHVQSAQLVR